MQRLLDPRLWANCRYPIGERWIHCCSKLADQAAPWIYPRFGQQSEVIGSWGADSLAERTSGTGEMRKNLGGPILGSAHLKEKFNRFSTLLSVHISRRES